MLTKYLDIAFNINEKLFKGFCVRISDQFYDTYAVVLEGYHSCTVWFNNKTNQWQFRCDEECLLMPMEIEKLLDVFKTNHLSLV